MQYPTRSGCRDDGRWLGSRTWPVPFRDTVLSLTADGRAVPGPAPAGSVRWSDGPAGRTAPARQAFVTAPVTRATRLSGQVVFDLAYTLTGTDTSLAVRIDALPPTAADGAPVAQKVLDGAHGVRAAPAGLSPCAPGTSCASPSRPPRAARSRL